MELCTIVTCAEPYTIFHSEKIKALKTVVDEYYGEPVLVAYNFKFQHDEIKKAFKNAVDIKEDNAVERWCEGKINLLLAHPASAGHGLNLQSGGRVIVWYSLPWSLEHYDQFNARLYRKGQIKPVVVHRIIARATAEEEVATALENKSSTQDGLLDAIKLKQQLKEGI